MNADRMVGIAKSTDLSAEKYNDQINKWVSWWNEHNSGARAWDFVRASNIIGTTTNNNAAAGSVGEFVSSTILRASAVNSGATGVFTNITSISLTAGDWDVTGQPVMILATATSTALRMATSAFSGNTTTDHIQGDNDLNSNPATGAYDMGLTIANWRVSIAATTTIYLKAAVTFSAGQPTLYGRISARRVR